ncbi:MAG: BcrAD BadFG protein [Patescibacteria group bacterium]|nr:BcrAD BadFG protein [Patescibacteria group bacterium]
MTKLYLGIDGGGTKTEVICTTENQEIVGKGLSGPTNLTSTTAGAAAFNLKEAVRQALENAPPDAQVASATMGLAGMDTAQEYEMAYQPFADILNAFHVQKFRLVHDSMIALENGTTNPNAVVLIAGTGSICVGKNDKNETAKTGGMDYLLTDQGSGYDIGRHVLREAVKSYDGRRTKTMLEKLVCEHFGIDTLETLKMHIYHPPLTKQEIAELSMLCTTAYKAGDPAARQIYEWAQAELVRMAETVIRKLGLEHTPTDLVLTGSIVLLEHMRAAVVQRLLGQFPAIIPVVPDRPAMYGALQLAIRFDQHDL